MVRGAAKGVSQSKKEAKDLAKAKSVKRDSSESKKVKEAGVTLVCDECKAGMPNAGALLQHYSNR
jgi:hypothetical protein